MTAVAAPVPPQNPPQDISTTSYVLNATGRIFSKTEMFDKMLKLINGILLGVQVHWANTLITVKLVSDRIKSVNDTTAGLINFPSKINEFLIKRDKEGHIILLKNETIYKIMSRASLSVASFCETLKTLGDFGVNTAAAAAKIGQYPIFNILIGAGLRRVKDVAVVISSSLSIVDALINLAYPKIPLVPPKEGTKEWRELEAKLLYTSRRAKLTLVNDSGKIALILCASAIYFTYGYALMIITTYAAAVAKTLMKDYKEYPIEKDIMWFNKKPAPAPKAAAAAA